MINNTNRDNEKGMALVTLIMFVLIATIYISAAVVIMVVNTQSSTTVQQGIVASRLAEGVLEDTLLRLLRDPTYSGGSFNLETGNATVNITGDTTKNVSVVLDLGNYTKKYKAQVDFIETEMSVLSWGEDY